MPLASSSWRCTITTHRDNCRRRSGFTLLELLVATTILLVMVLSLVKITNQGTVAWEVGTHMVESSMRGRAALNFMVRDISMAVADDDFSFDVSANTISFVALTDGSSANRVARKISYQLSGNSLQRRVDTMAADAGAGTYPVWTVGAWTTVIDGVESGGLVFTWGGWAGSPSDELPRWVDIELVLADDDSTGRVRVRSAGSDRTFGTDDDVTLAKHKGQT